MMFGERLRTLRRNAHLTQQELGKRLGVSTSAIGMYEQNRRTPDHTVIGRVCDVFGVSADYLLRDASEDLSVLLREMRMRLSSKDALMFDGVPLSDEDARAVLDAMEVGARIALEHHENSR